MKHFLLDVINIVLSLGIGISGAVIVFAIVYHLLDTP